MQAVVTGALIRITVTDIPSMYDQLVTTRDSSKNKELHKDMNCLDDCVKMLV
jgi:hypothetical protein